MFTGSFNRIEHQYGNLARGGFFLILREMRGPLPQPAPDHVALGRFGRTRPDVKGLGADLAGRVWMGEQVVIPGRVRGAPAFGAKTAKLSAFPLAQTGRPIRWKASGLTRSVPVRAPVWCRRRMPEPANGPPTVAPLARNSAMILLLKSSGLAMTLSLGKQI